MHTQYLKQETKEQTYAEREKKQPREEKKKTINTIDHQEEKESKNNCSLGAVLKRKGR